jgi:hypothetical protein
MERGDIVRVRLRESPRLIKIGIVVNPPRKMYMFGYAAEVMVDGKIKRIKEEHIQNISKGEYANEG